MNFWKELQSKKKPFFVLAPMANVTDVAFRELLVRYGKPDVMWTEFVSANGLMSKGRDLLLYDLDYSEAERPIVAQLFTSNPETMKGAVALCIEKGFDGIDINMGCPDKTIEKQGSGAAHIKDKETACAVIGAAKEAIQESGKDIPLSIKTRLGYSTYEIDSWIRYILLQKPAALTVHLRTRKQLSKVPAQWEYMKEIVALRDEVSPETVIIGNGDVISLKDGKEKAFGSGADGVMVGRALFGNPWFFDERREVVSSLPKRRHWILRSLPFFGKFFDTKRGAAQSKNNPIRVEERLMVMVEHATLFEEKLGKVKNFAVFKKHMKAYCTGFKGAKELRVRLMEESFSASDVQRIVGEFLK
jgi:tRNA-dihydrouridine synthase